MRENLLSSGLVFLLIFGVRKSLYRSNDLMTELSDLARLDHRRNGIIDHITFGFGNQRKT
ncbi:Uncharacterised protein [Vibrio cholerae]|nr:Uncharacterised protein [Vibrio cholerae]